jgi:hypothetical protein
MSGTRRFWAARGLWAIVAAAFLGAVAGGRGQSFSAFFAGDVHEKTSVTIRTDGTASVVVDIKMARAAADKMAGFWQRFRAKAGEEEAVDDDDDTGKAKAEPESTATNSLANTELAGKIRDMANTTAKQAGLDPGKLDVNASKETVRIQVTRDLSSLEELVPEISDLPPSFERAQFEIDSGGHIRATLVPRQMGGLDRPTRGPTKLHPQETGRGLSAELRFIFPGKVISSGLPESDSNSTWISADAQKPESLAAFDDVFSNAVVMVCEAGGLKLDGPVESTLGSELSATKTDELPVTEAGPGFRAEVLSINAEKLSLFPAGDNPSNGLNRTPAQKALAIRGRLYAPDGRIILSSGAAKIIKAVDNSGRSIPPVPEETEPEDPIQKILSSTRAASNSTPIQLRLEWPAPGAVLIDQIETSVVALTVGAFKETVITNTQSSVPTEISLAAVLPGAKLVIKKANLNRNQSSWEIEISGPRKVARLAVFAKTSEDPDESSDTTTVSTQSRGGRTVRLVSVRRFNANNNSPLALVVRYPDDPRRQRAHFTLEAIRLPE